MLRRSLPLLAALTPLIGINVAYWLGARNELLPTCNPWLDGCTSISSTGRFPPGDRVFRIAMLSQAAWLVLTWYFAARWLRAFQDHRHADRIVLTAGTIGAVALVAYVYYLTSKDPFYEIMKTWGIYFYFVGTALCQVVVSASMAPSRPRSLMLGLCITPFALGFFNFVQKVVYTEINSVENRIEWIAALLMQLWFLGLFVVWRRSDEPLPRP